MGRMMRREWADIRPEKGNKSPSESSPQKTGETALPPAAAPGGAVGVAGGAGLTALRQSVIQPGFRVANGRARWGRDGGCGGGDSSSVRPGRPPFPANDTGKISNITLACQQGFRLNPLPDWGRFRGLTAAVSEPAGGGFGAAYSYETAAGWLCGGGCKPPGPAAASHPAAAARNWRRLRYGHLHHRGFLASVPGGREIAGGGRFADVCRWRFGAL